MTTAALHVDLSAVEADRLAVAVDRHATVEDLDDARDLVRDARRGFVDCTLAPLARHCLRCEGNAPDLLMRLTADHTVPVL